MKIIFETTHKGARVYIERNRKLIPWTDKSLTPEEIAAIQSAGLVMQKGTLSQCLLSCKYNTTRKILRLEKSLNKALEILQSITPQDLQPPK